MRSANFSASQLCEGGQLRAFDRCPVRLFPLRFDTPSMEHHAQKCASSESF